MAGDNKSNLLQYVVHIDKKLHKVRELAGKKEKESQHAMKECCDKTADGTKFETGDKVLAFAPCIWKTTASETVVISENDDNDGIDTKLAEHMNIEWFSISNCSSRRNSTERHCKLIE